MREPSQILLMREHTLTPMTDRQTHAHLCVYVLHTEVSVQHFALKLHEVQLLTEFRGVFFPFWL